VRHWVSRLRKATDRTFGVFVQRQIVSGPIFGNLLHKRRRAAIRQLRYPAASTSDYYQNVHQTNDAYKANNWLLSELDTILSIEPKTVIEVGCGNGRFLAAIKGRVELVIGVDWARSPVLDELGLSGNFRHCDITKHELPQADIVCSADVLEHIAPDLLAPTLQRLDRAGHHQYHLIACYDDGHSHLSIMPPDAWLLTFQAVSNRYRLVDTRQRRGDPSQLICVISTFESKRSPMLAS
jgi:SAM-dependent methyltransferase